MTAAVIATVTYPQALRLAVEALVERLAVASLTHDQLRPGALWSELQDVVIDIGRSLGASYAGRVTFAVLPAAIRELYVSALKRCGRGDAYPLNYHLGALIRTIRTSLTEIPSI